MNVATSAITRSMGLLRRGKAHETGEFIAAAASDAVREGQMTPVRLGGRRIILTRLDGRAYAIDSACPHAAADLGKGTLRHWQLCCREHDYCFDIRTGRIVWPEDEVYRLRRYEAKEEGGEVLVRLAPPR